MFQFFFFRFEKNFTINLFKFKFSYTKPATFADCIGDELPIGWEQAYHPLLGNYFIDHKRRLNQLDDPRVELLAVQANMVMGYLEQANGWKFTLKQIK